MEARYEKRISNFVIFAVLIFIEVLIAIYIHDDFIRPYVGDIIVVWVIFFFVRCFIPNKLRTLPLWVFLFAVAVEVMQYFEVVELLGLGEIKFFRTVIGTSFSFIDIGCYAFGCALLVMYESFKRRKRIAKSAKARHGIASKLPKSK